MDEKRPKKHVAPAHAVRFTRIEWWLSLAMLLLSLAWLVLIVIDMVSGLIRPMQIAFYTIWGIFILEFILRLTAAPHKLSFLKKNWFSAVSLAVPVFRTLQFAWLLRIHNIARTARVLRAVRMLKVLTTIHRGMKALGAAMHRRGFGYVVLLTAIVTFAGAAGIYTFEKGSAAAGPRIDSYGTALWWTAMMMTTMGTQFWPVTPEGRVLCLLFAIYGFSVFGYVTATLASFFVGRDGEDEKAAATGTEAITGLREEIAALRNELRSQRLITGKKERRDGD